MARPGVPLGAYEPRATAGTVLHHVVRTHLERFLAATATDGAGVPHFIEREFRDFLGCGALDRGFARVRCGDCAFERLVPFSCKGRAVCPSCGGRRMAEQAAHLVDAVLPVVPVRQWVLTVPHRLRYRLAFDHKLCRAVLGVFVHAVLAWYRRRARRDGVTDGQSGPPTAAGRPATPNEVSQAQSRGSRVPGRSGAGVARVADGLGDREAYDGDRLAPQGIRPVLELEEPPEGRATAPGRNESRTLIRQMARDNVGWGARRIHGELLKLGLVVSEATVSRPMPRRCEPTSSG